MNREICCQVSMQALTGTASGNSMRIISTVGKQVMVMLIDSGSSSDFISEHMVQKLGLAVAVCPSASVKMADGNCIVSDKLVRIVEWWAFDHVFHTDMRVLPLSAFDAILGYDWLRKHSPMQCDWERKVLQIVDEGVKVTLWGDGVEKQTAVHDVSMLQVNKWICSNDIWSFVLLEAMQGKEEGDKAREVQQLLHEDIFAVPKQLPPSRPHDHHIPLIPGSVPVNVKPYRYSPFHKDEIGKQVVSMLEAGLSTQCEPFCLPSASCQEER